MVQVTLLDTMELATFCVRTFSLHKVNPFAVLRLRSAPDPRARFAPERSRPRRARGQAEEICLSRVICSNRDSLPVSGAEIRSPL